MWYPNLVKEFLLGDLNKSQNRDHDNYDMGDLEMIHSISLGGS